MLRKFILTLIFLRLLKKINVKFNGDVMIKLIGVLDVNMVNRYNVKDGIGIKIETYCDNCEELLNSIFKYISIVRDGKYLTDIKKDDGKVMSLDDYLTDMNGYPVSLDIVIMKLKNSYSNLLILINEHDDDFKQYYIRKLNHIDVEITNFLNALNYIRSLK